ncbi:hypothetical protein PM082_022102 [Marasmius tenuissimus]|nr:hypothetical protein PM082_022102 [Marasmius tenuissimus]
MATTTIQNVRANTQTSSATQMRTPSGIPRPINHAATIGSSTSVPNTSRNTSSPTISSSRNNRVPNPSESASSETARNLNVLHTNEPIFSTPSSSNSLFDSETPVASSQPIQDETDCAAVRRGKLPMSTLRVGTIKPSSPDEEVGPEDSISQVPSRSQPVSRMDG